MRKKLSIIGLGWFGMELAKTLCDDCEVFGTKRKALGMDTDISVFPLTFHPEPSGTSLERLLRADFLVFNIPPNSRRESAKSDYRIMMDFLLEAMTGSPLQRAVFVSSTGVFGKSAHTVDEDSVPEPSTKSGEILLEAERRFLSISSVETVVLRPSGLVGGDRHPVKYLAGRSGIGGALHPVNLVHREDLITLTTALLAAPELKREVYHAIAGFHPTKKDYYTAMAQKKGLSLPEFDQKDETLGKKVRGEKSKAELGVTFKFDDPFEMI